MTSSDSSLRADVQLRIKGKIEKSVPDEAERQAALALLAYAIENADDERDNAWYLRETWQGLALCAGRLQACAIGRGKVEISVMGPIGDDVRTSLGAEPRENEAWKAIPGGVLLSIPVGKATAALELLKEPLDQFVDEAMVSPPVSVGTIFADITGDQVPVHGRSGLCPFGL